MNLLLHAITTPPEAGAPAIRGLTRIDVLGLSTWTSDSPSTFSRENLLDHHRVVSEIFAAVDACLPARFPTVVDAPTLKEFVVERHTALVKQLEEVRGACELAITAIWTTLEEPTPVGGEVSPGRRYLLERQAALNASEQRRARATRLADMIVGEIDVVRDSRRQVCPSATVALSLALLVPRDTVEATRARLPRTAPDVRILVNGPWPPYTFASIRSD